jgi:hypothetical protein
MVKPKAASSEKLQRNNPRMLTLPEALPVMRAGQNGVLKTGDSWRAISKATRIPKAP